MDPVNEENGRSISPAGECDASVAPFEAALFAADKIWQQVDAFARKRVVDSSRSKERAAGNKKLPDALTFVGFNDVFVFDHTLTETRQRALPSMRTESRAVNSKLLTTSAAAALFCLAAGFPGRRFRGFPTRAYCGALFCRPGFLPGRFPAT
jgi:hypothetical protein